MDPMKIYHIQLSIEYTVTGPTFAARIPGGATQHRLCGKWLEKYEYDVVAEDAQAAKNYAVFEIDKVFAKRRNRYRNGIKWASSNKLTYIVCHEYTNTTVLRFHRLMKKRID